MPPRKTPSLEFYRLRESNLLAEELSWWSEESPQWTLNKNHMDSSLTLQVTPRKLGHFLSLTPGQYHSRLDYAVESKRALYTEKWPHSVETMEPQNTTNLAALASDKHWSDTSSRNLELPLVS